MRSRHALRGLLFCGLVWVCCGSGCPPTDDINGDGGGGGDGQSTVAPATLGGTVNVASLTIPSGSTTTVTSNLNITTTGDVTINGKLAADPASSSGGKGSSITINAGGKIDISGTVQAGNGAAGDATTAAGGAGGALSLSAGGNLTVAANAVLASGSGGGGAASGLGGAGGVGGDLLLKTGQTLTVRGTLTIGNGGQGGAPNSGSLTGADQFTGHGGNSGILIVDSNTVDWPGYDSLEGSVDLNQVSIQGGRGGDGASFTIKAVQDNAKAAAVTQNQGVEISIPWVFSCEPGCRFEAPDGGYGAIYGGDGGDLKIEPSDMNMKWVTDGIPYDVTAWGGSGGNIPCSVPGTGIAIHPAAGAVAGMGGTVSITGISGGPGRPGQEVWAYGGFGGDAICGTYGKGGAGGKAVARGGDGGKGADGDCSVSVGAGHGDPGGGGGNAHADGGSGGSGYFGGNGGDAEAYGGQGADGGMPQGAPGGGGGASAFGGSAGAQWAMNLPSYVPPPKKGFEITSPGSPGITGDDCP